MKELDWQMPVSWIRGLCLLCFFSFHGEYAEGVWIGGLNLAERCGSHRE